MKAKPPHLYQNTTALTLSAPARDLVALLAQNRSSLAPAHGTLVLVPADAALSSTAQPDDDRGWRVPLANLATAYRPPSGPSPSPEATAGGYASLAEVLSALSFALDLVEDAKPGHAIRSCLLGMRIAHAMQLSITESADLYYALLLKDVGCSTNANLICQLVGGDDRVIKREARLEDWTRASFSAVRLMWRNPRPGARLTERLGRLINMALHHDRSNAQVIGMRCERGALIARKIGLTTQTAEAIRSLDEHWDGSGHPDRLSGKAIPVIARILNVAQHLDIFAVALGPQEALNVILERSGRWFDPVIVRVVRALDAEQSLWEDYGSGQERNIVRALEPGYALEADERQIDNIAEAFADIIDAKSSFTFQHSLGVTKAALGIAHEFNFSPRRRNTIFRASLLHDLGKLRVSNSILDKTTKPNEQEWSIIREHPGLTREILGRIGAFSDVAVIAGNHHEKLDGSGYPLKLTGKDLPLEARLLTVADIYGALSENRPYRAGLDHEKIRSLLLQDIPHKLDPDCVEALLRSLERNQPQVATAALSH